MKTRVSWLKTVAEYIVSCDGREYDDYVGYCKDNEIDPSNIEGFEQSKHVYAQALMGLGLKFPVEDREPIPHLPNGF